MSVSNLAGLAEEHLQKAGQSKSGRSAVTIFGGHDKKLRQTLIALKDGNGLDEHASPGEATLQVLRGSLVLRTETSSWQVGAGEIVFIPEEVHAVDSLEDVVFLLTVVKSV